MLDRRVAEALSKGGDPLTEPRRVDHWIYFASEPPRDAFIEEARTLGFAVEDATNEPDKVVPDRAAFAARPFVAHIYRTDSVQLDEIHEVAWTLHELASRHGGEYDGWQTSVETGR